MICVFSFHCEDLFIYQFLLFFFMFIYFNKPVFCLINFSSTDSELCFYLILNELEDVIEEQKEKDGDDDTILPAADLYKTAIVRAIRKLVKAIDAVNNARKDAKSATTKDAVDSGSSTNASVAESPAVSMLNFCFTDGDICCATKFVYPVECVPASLYYASGSEFAPIASQNVSEQTVDDGAEEQDFRMLQHDKRQMCHIVTSEPLSTDVDDWIPVPKNTILTINERENLILESIEL